MDASLKEKKSFFWFYAIVLGFAALNAAFIAFENFYFVLLPFILLVVGFYFFSLDKILWLIVFATPLSLNIKNPDFGFGISMPSEPLMIGVLFLFIFRLFRENKIDRQLIFHPISIVIVINLLWIFITSLTSTMPLVSFKFLFARLWFIASFYYFGIVIFKQPKNFLRFVALYCLGFAIVIAYTIYNHKLFGFTQEASNWVMSPFYNDHTSYGAMLAMFLPALIGFLFIPNKTLMFKTIVFGAVVVFVIALLLSYTRAAWLSLVVALGIFVIIFFEIKLRTLVISFLALSVLGIIFSQKILFKLEKNRQDSSTDIAQHVKSISNISSDASNLERINRWEAAIRMFKKKPFFGFGPGTYAFKYAPYQFSYEKTIISTNAGNKGNAHSEYIGPLCESGVFGMLSFLLIVLVTSVTAVRLLKQLQDKTLKILVGSAFLGLSTYFVHGTLNNFLDTDKASVPFWGFIALIAAIDIYQKKKTTQAE
jgi:putative inorganic carbon (hco3(-)) transporter